MHYSFTGSRFTASCIVASRPVPPAGAPTPREPIHPQGRKDRRYSSSDPMACRTTLVHSPTRLPRSLFSGGGDIFRRCFSHRIDSRCRISPSIVPRSAPARHCPPYIRSLTAAGRFPVCFPTAVKCERTLQTRNDPNTAADFCCSYPKPVAEEAAGPLFVGLQIVFCATSFLFSSSDWRIANVLRFSIILSA